MKLIYRSKLGQRDDKGNLNVEPWGINGAGPEIIALCISIPVYLLLTIFLEKRLIKNLDEKSNINKNIEKYSAEEKDSLVLAEEERV